MKKIFTATLGTETNTFASIPTGHQLFEETCLFRKGSYGKNVPMFGAPLAVWRGRAEAKGWQVVESLCAFAMPAGRTVKKVYEAFRDEIVADLKAALPVDGVFLSMHGAMVAEGYDDCESDILAHVRKAVGPDVPVGVELDLHCNIGEGTLRDATALVLFKEYPHVDVPERADDLFDVMEGAIEGRTKPVMAAWDCKMIGVFHTTRQPMRGFVDKLQAMEGKDGVLSLSIAHGFPWSDIKEMGSKVIAITDGDRPKAEKLARELGQEFFAMREATQPPYVSLDAAMARVSSHNLPKPMVLADVSDNAGGGAASDSTFILKALLDKKVKDAAIGMFWDPGAVKLAFEVGEGAELDIRLGGKLGPQSGPPIDGRAKVLKLEKNVTIEFGGERKSVGSIGDAAALQIDGVTVIVNSKRTQCLSRDCFTKLGVDPSTKKIVVVKSMQHFHAAYAPIASEVVYVAAPGALVPDWSLLPYTKVDKAQWPFVANPHVMRIARPRRRPARRNGGRRPRAIAQRRAHAQSARRHQGRGHLEPGRARRRLRLRRRHAGRRSRDQQAGRGRRGPHPPGLPQHQADRPVRGRDAAGLRQAHRLCQRPRADRAPGRQGAGRAVGQAALSAAHHVRGQAAVRQRHHRDRQRLLRAGQEVSATSWRCSRSRSARRAPGR